MLINTFKWHEIDKDNVSDTKVSIYKRYSQIASTKENYKELYANLSLVEFNYKEKCPIQTFV
jgi:hypothetical protein